MHGYFMVFRIDISYISNILLGYLCCKGTFDSLQIISIRQLEERTSKLTAQARFMFLHTYGEMGFMSSNRIRYITSIFQINNKNNNHEYEIIGGILSLNWMKRFFIATTQCITIIVILLAFSYYDDADKLHIFGFYFVLLIVSSKLHKVEKIKVRN